MAHSKLSSSDQAKYPMSGTPSAIASSAAASRCETQVARAAPHPRPTRQSPTTSSQGRPVLGDGNGGRAVVPRNACAGRHARPSGWISHPFAVRSPAAPRARPPRSPLRLRRRGDDAARAGSNSRQGSRAAAGSVTADRSSPSSIPKLLVPIDQCRRRISTTECRVQEPADAWRRRSGRGLRGPPDLSPPGSR